jgi:hypothetical protein
MHYNVHAVHGYAVATNVDFDAMRTALLGYYAEAALEGLDKPAVYIYDVDNPTLVVAHLADDGFTNVGCHASLRTLFTEFFDWS